MTNPQSVTRVRATATTDGYGDTVHSWVSPDELVIDGCMLAPVINEENNDFGRQGVLVGWTLYRREPADVLPGDRIETVSDGVFEVDGQPANWSSPFSSFAGLQATLKRVDG